MKKPMTRAVQVELTKATVLDAAIDLFLENGYEVASMNVLVKRVGCSKETIYKYFGSKKGLFLSVIDKILEDTLANLTGMDIQFMPLRDGLQLASYSTLEKLFTGRYVRLRQLVATSTESVPDTGREYYDYVAERSYGILGAFFELHVQQANLKDIDTQRMAKYFWGMLLYNISLQLDYGKKARYTRRELREHADIVIEDFILTFSVQ